MEEEKQRKVGEMQKKAVEKKRQEGEKKKKIEALKKNGDKREKGGDRNGNRKKCKLEESDFDMSSFIIYDDNSSDDCWPPNFDESGDERDDGNACYVCKRTDDLDGWVGCDECVRWFHRRCCRAKKISFKNG
ncbi:hypothetical protein PoB_003958000 [Plakobranchus ocellatus]|uniref:PHD-type domain-containing protein n=1 Tax=Plakobranchus ocellatus TaxID=259542 RepID=A0AAV4AXI7_9GAST|nr:hypothetical protein PoB_003958000 [Plakobranchus ocellatus]